jgi:aspartyl-tRNA(Asn)/glutamyl-tRNA(Gln) amidotransferase subunit A
MAPRPTRRAVATGLGAALGAARARASPRPDAAFGALTLAEAAEAVRSGRTTASALTDACFARIAVLEPRLNAFISLFQDQARREAAALDAEARAGRWRGPLHGVPVSLKDNIDTAGERTTGGSPVFESRVPAEDAPAVARLRAAGAIVIGKNTLNELAMSDGRSSFFGRVHNPWNLDRQTGGSSSGSCAAVASEMVYAALGTDTGGSIRNPAAWCGVVGLKPTNGLVPNRGTLPLTPSLDTIGPIARSVEDAAILLGVIAGYDRLDVTSDPHPGEDYQAALRQPVEGLRVGRLVGHFDRLDPGVARSVDAALALVGTRTRTVGDAELPAATEAMALMPFGETYAWYEPYLKTDRLLFSAGDQATLDSLANTKAADYIRARWAMERLRRTVNDAFAGVDVMVYPTVHVTAPPIAAADRPDPDGARARGALFDAGLFNVLGLPAVSVPCGFDRDGLPIGLCFVGPRFGEGKMLAVARACS